MDTTQLARRGRIALWILIGYVLGQGVLSRYGLPDALYYEINELLAGDYAQQERALREHPWAEGLHRLLGVAMLVLGMLQFDARLRAARPRVHRLSGRVFLLLAVAIGTSGLYLGFVVPFAGDAERVFITVVGAAFFGFAVRAWRLARTRRFALHREWMVRLLSLSFFIAVQRVLVPVLRPWLGVADPALFIITGWLAVGIVLATGEAWVRATRAPRASPVPSSEPASA